MTAVERETIQAMEMKRATARTEIRISKKAGASEHTIRVGDHVAYGTVDVLAGRFHLNRSPNQDDYDAVTAALRSHDAILIQE